MISTADDKATNRWEWSQLDKNTRHWLRRLYRNARHIYRLDIPTARHLTICGQWAADAERIAGVAK